jgi:CMP-N-acetylneuraminic acid synthetase
MKKGNIKTVIPSRLGSTRVKMKGMRLLNSLTLVEHTINALKQSKYLREEIYINSDCDLWQQIAERNEVNFYQRKPELATSTSMIDDYLYDFMVHCPSEYLAVITPTAPFITGEDFDNAWLQFADSDSETIISTEKIQTHCVYKNEPLNYGANGQLPRTQDLEPVLALNFSIAIYDCEAFKRNYSEKGFAVLAGKTDYFVLNGFNKTDIDFEEDFMLAEVISKFLTEQKSYTPQYSDVVKHLIDTNTAN